MRIVGSGKNTKTLVWVCGDCKAEYKNRIDAKECCNGFEFQALSEK